MLTWPAQGIKSLKAARPSDRKCTTSRQTSSRSNVKPPLCSSTSGALDTVTDTAQPTNAPQAHFPPGNATYCSAALPDSHSHSDLSSSPDPSLPYSPPLSPYRSLPKASSVKDSTGSHTENPSDPSDPIGPSDPNGWESESNQIQSHKRRRWLGDGGGGVDAGGQWSMLDNIRSIDEWKEIVQQEPGVRSDAALQLLDLLAELVKAERAKHITLSASSSSTSTHQGHSTDCKQSRESCCTSDGSITSGKALQPLVSPLFPALQKATRSFNCQDLTRLCSCLASLRVSPPPALMEVLVRSALSRSHVWSQAQGLELLDALKSFDKRPPAVLRLLDSVPRLLGSLTDLSHAEAVQAIKAVQQLAGSMPSSESPLSSWWSHACWSLSQRVSYFDSHTLTSLLHAASFWTPLPSPAVTLFLRAVPALCEQLDRDEIPPSRLCVLLHSFAGSNMYHTSLWQEACRFLLRFQSWPSMSARDVSDLIWIMGRSRHWNPLVMAQLCKTAAGKLHEMTPRQLSLLCWSLAKLRYPHSRSFMLQLQNTILSSLQADAAFIITPAAARVAPEGSSGQQHHTVARWQVRDVCQVVWSLSVLATLSSNTFQQLLTQLELRLQAQGGNKRPTVPPLTSPKAPPLVQPSLFVQPSSLPPLSSNPEPTGTGTPTIGTLPPTPSSVTSGSLKEGRSDMKMFGVAESAMASVAESARVGVAESARVGVAESAMASVAETAMASVAESAMARTPDGTVSSTVTTLASQSSPGDQYSFPAPNSPGDQYNSSMPQLGHESPSSSASGRGYAPKFSQNSWQLAHLSMVKNNLQTSPTGSTSHDSSEFPTQSSSELRFGLLEDTSSYNTDAGVLHRQLLHSKDADSSRSEQLHGAHNNGPFVVPPQSNLSSQQFDQHQSSSHLPLGSSVHTPGLGPTHSHPMSPHHFSASYSHVFDDSASHGRAIDDSASYGRAIDDSASYDRAIDDSAWLPSLSSSPHSLMNGPSRAECSQPYSTQQPHPPIHASHEQSVSIGEQLSRVFEQLVSDDEQSTRIDEQSARNDGHSVSIDEQSVRNDGQSVSIDEHFVLADGQLVSVDEPHLITPTEAATLLFPNPVPRQGMQAPSMSVSTSASTSASTAVVETITPPAKGANKPCMMMSAETKAIEPTMASERESDYINVPLQPIGPKDLTMASVETISRPSLSSPLFFPSYSPSSALLSQELQGSRSQSSHELQQSQSQSSQELQQSQSQSSQELHESRSQSSQQLQQTQPQSSQELQLLQPQSSQESQSSQPQSSQELQLLQPQSSQELQQSQSQSSPLSLSSPSSLSSAQELQLQELQQSRSLCQAPDVQAPAVGTDMGHHPATPPRLQPAAAIAANVPSEQILSGPLVTDSSFQLTRNSAVPNAIHLRATSAPSNSSQITSTLPPPIANLRSNNHTSITRNNHTSLEPNNHPPLPYNQTSIPYNQTSIPYNQTTIPYTKPYLAPNNHTLSPPNDYASSPILESKPQHLTSQHLTANQHVTSQHLTASQHLTGSQHLTAIQQTTETSQDASVTSQKIHLKPPSSVGHPSPIDSRQLFQAGLIFRVSQYFRQERTKARLAGVQTPLNTPPEVKPLEASLRALASAVPRTSDVSAVHSSDVSVVHSSDVSAVHSSDVSAVHSSDVSAVHSSDVSAVHSSDVSAVHSSNVSAVHSSDVWAVPTTSDASTALAASDAPAVPSTTGVLGVLEARGCVSATGSACVSAATEVSVPATTAAAAVEAGYLQSWSVLRTSSYRTSTYPAHGAVSAPHLTAPLSGCQPADLLPGMADSVAQGAYSHWCSTQFTRSPRRPPPVLQEVCHVLQLAGVQFKRRVASPSGLLCVELVINTPLQGVCRVAVLADGPAQYSRNEPYRLLGDALWNRRLLQAEGYSLLLVPFYMWRMLGNFEKKQQWLMDELQQLQQPNQGAG